MLETNIKYVIACTVGPSTVHTWVDGVDTICHRVEVTDDDLESVAILRNNCSRYSSPHE
jgi:hypothetical protein